MNEPPRLFAQPESELERALLDAGRSYSAPASMRAKTLLALGVSAVATSTAPSAAASSLTKAALSKVAVAVLVIGGAAVPAWRYLGHTSNTPVAPPPVLNAAPVVQAPPATPATSVTSVTSEIAPPAAVEAAELPAPSSAPSPSTARFEPRPSAAPPLAAELAALDSARASLSHSDPAAALVALDAYARNFPRGRLSLEAEVLRIGALAKSGQTTAARKRADTFLRLHPSSVLASRVRSYVGL